MLPRVDGWSLALYRTVLDGEGPPPQFLPRGVTHTFRSAGGPATVLFIVTPGHLDEFFRLKDEGADPAEVARLMQDFL